MKELNIGDKVNIWLHRNSEERLCMPYQIEAEVVSDPYVGKSLKYEFVGEDKITVTHYRRIKSHLFDYKESLEVLRITLTSSIKSSGDRLNRLKVEIEEKVEEMLETEKDTLFYQDLLSSVKGGLLYLNSKS